MNIAQSLVAGRNYYPDRPAVIFEEQTYSYQDLETAAAQTASGLRKLGVQQGDRVALFLPNCIEFIVCYFAIQYLGAIAVSISPMMKDADLAAMLNHSMSLVVITTAELHSVLPKAQLKSVRYVLIAEGACNTAINLADIREHDAERLTPVVMSTQAPAAILYTSGTTGLPKGVTLSHGNIGFTARSKQRYCAITPDDRLLLFLPLFHCFGQNAVMVSAINAGATLVLHRRFNLAAILESLIAHSVTMFFGVPATYITLLNSALEPGQFSAVRYFFSAAAMLPEVVATAWNTRFMIPIHEGYGLTETSPFASYNHLEQYRIGSIGMPIDGVRMKIVDDAGNELGDNQRGEIIINGPNVMLGYWLAEVDTQSVLRDGWLHSGDLGIRDTEGYFYIVDRLKDMINVSGFKVYPAEVERILYTHPAVHEAAVYGVADPLKGEVVHAQVVLMPSLSLDVDELLRYCYERTAPYKVPSRIEFVAALPKNPSGKVLRRLLR